MNGTENPVRWDEPFPWERKPLRTARMPHTHVFQELTPGCVACDSIRPRVMKMHPYQLHAEGQAGWS